jgi:hypothetical protein
MYNNVVANASLSLRVLFVLFNDALLAAKLIPVIVPSQM